MPHIEQELISAYVDHQLDAAEIHALEAHLGGCADCRAVLDEMRALTGLFRDAERVEPSPFLWGRIEANLHGPRTLTRGWRTVFTAGLGNQRRALGIVAAALALCLAIGITIFHKNARQVAEQAALAAIDQTYRSLAAHDPEVYNPFSSGSLRDLDANPFRILRLGGKTARGTGGE
jgi:anti-sigma factor RsiW